MYRKTLLSLLTVFISVALYAQEYSKMKGSELCSLRKNNPSVPALKSSPNSPRHTFDVLDYNLDLDLRQCYLSPFPKNFTGKNIVSFKVDTTLSSIVLNAENSSLQILSVSGAGVSYTHLLNKLQIQLDRTYQPGEEAQVIINYSHKNVNDNAFYVGSGFVFTDCEPQGARKWFPCYDEPSDKATLTLRAKVPNNVKLGSNGRLADSVVVADSLWYTWISRDPISTYLMVISSKVNYNLDIYYHTNPFNPVDTLPIRFYFNAGENPDPMIQIIGPLTNYYESLFGEHPFEKNGFATVGPQFTWGGMENQTLTSLCPGCWQNSLLAHEYAHQWFGDMITCATWADIWLNEGFATYVEALWTGQQYGYDSYVAEIEDNANYYLYYNPGWAISDPSWATNPPSNNVLFNYAITYMKGSCVLYMYRNVVGDSLFFESLKQYATDSVNFRYQAATIGDFMDKMNEVIGQDLDYFFNQWIYTPNHPVYQSIYDFIDKGNDQWEVKLQINQIQTNTGFFQMPIELKVFFSEGDTTFTIMNTVNTQNFSFSFNKRPVGIQFDPNNKIVLKQSTLIMASENIAPEKNSLTVLKNPSNGNFKIEYTSNENATLDYVVLSSNGLPVTKKSGVNISSGDNIIPVDLSNCSSGLYILNVRCAGKSLSEKLIITK